MIGWVCVIYLQWIDYPEIFVLGHFPAYHVLPYGVSVSLVKLDGSFENSWNLDIILVFYGMSLSLIRKDIVRTDKVLRIIGEAHFPHPNGRVEEPIISRVDRKGDIVIFLFWYLYANMSIFQRLRAPLIPNHHLEISCGRQYCQIPTYYIHPNYYS